MSKLEEFRSGKGLGRWCFGEGLRPSHGREEKEEGEELHATGEIAAAGAGIADPATALSAVGFKEFISATI